MIAVVGIGNRLRADDGAGPETARLVSEIVGPGVIVKQTRGESLDLFDAWDGARVAILADAMLGSSPAGTIHRWELGEAPLPEEYSGQSTHDFSLGQAIELARALGRLPAKVIVYAIRGTDFTTGAPMSPEVQEALPALAQRILGEIERWKNARSVFDEVVDE